MSAIPPRWVEPLRYRFRDSEIVQLNLPERTGVVSAMFLGVLEQLGIGSMGHYSQSPEVAVLHGARAALGELGSRNAARSGAVRRAHGPAAFERKTQADRRYHPQDETQDRSDRTRPPHFRQSGAGRGGDADRGSVHSTSQRGKLRAERRR